MRRFRLRIGVRGADRLDFVCIAASAMGAVMQHMHLALENERIECEEIK